MGVRVYVGKGGLVLDSGDRVLCYAEQLACHPTTGPFLEKFQAIFEPSLLTCSFLHHVNASTGRRKKKKLEPFGKV